MKKKRVFKLPSVDWWNFLSSRNLTNYLLGLGGLYYLVLLIAFGAEAATLARGIKVWGGGTDISQLVAQTFYGKLYFILLLSNLFARLINSLLQEQAKFSPEFTQRINADFITNLRTHTVIGTPVKGKTDKLIQKILLPVASQQYSLTSGEDQNGWRLFGAKGRVLFWSKFVFKASVLVFLIGFLLSLSTRAAGVVYVGEGQLMENPAKNLEQSNYSWTELEEKDEIDRLQVTSFQIDQIDPALNKSFQPKPGKYIFSHPVRAMISYSTDSGERKTDVLGFYPPNHIKGYYFFLTRFGLGPGVWIKDEMGRDIYKGFLMLKIFPPGSEDTFKIPGLPYNFHLSLVTNLKGRKSSLTELVDLRHPVYHLLITKDTKKIYEGIVFPQQVIEFERLKLSFPETRFWVGVGILRDWGLPSVLGGIILATLSLFAVLLLSLLSMKEEIFVLLTQEDKSRQLYIGMNFRGIRRGASQRRFRRLLSELEELLGSQDL